jgi:hypothetical protein
MIETITVGDTLDFSTTVADYPPGDGWTLKFRLVPRAAGPTPILLTSAADGDAHRVQVGPTTAATWTAGDYSWTSWVEKTGARYTVSEGQVTLLPDPAVVTSRDNRSQVRKTLDAINAVIEGRATKDQQEYSIGDRTLKRMPIADLLKFRDRYRGEANAEANAERIAAGLGGRNRVLVRL